MRKISILVTCVLLARNVESQPEQPATIISKTAERYVQLVLAMGQHDLDYVDAFYGPAEWKSAVEKQKGPLDAIGTEAARLRELLVTTAVAADEMERLRREYLTKQLSALEARVRIVKGERMNFNEESRPLRRCSAGFPGSEFSRTAQYVLEGRLKSSVVKDGQILDSLLYVKTLDDEDWKRELFSGRASR